MAVGEFVADRGDEEVQPIRRVSDIDVLDESAQSLDNDRLSGGVFCAPYLAVR